MYNNDERSKQSKLKAKWQENNTGSVRKETKMALDPFCRISVKFSLESYFVFSM